MSAESFACAGEDGEFMALDVDLDQIQARQAIVLHELVERQRGCIDLFAVRTEVAAVKAGDALIVFAAKRREESLASAARADAGGDHLDIVEAVEADIGAEPF